MKSLVVVAILLYSGAGFATARHQNAGMPKPAQVVNQKALWQPGMEIMGAIRDVCGSAPNFGQCFVAQMQKSGASPQAITFTKLTGNTGFMRDFREAGWMLPTSTTRSARTRIRAVCSSTATLG